MRARTGAHSSAASGSWPRPHKSGGRTFRCCRHTGSPGCTRRCFGTAAAEYPGESDPSHRRADGPPPCRHLPRYSRNLPGGEAPRCPAAVSFPRSASVSSPLRVHCPASLQQFQFPSPAQKALLSTFLWTISFLFLIITVSLNTFPYGNRGYYYIAALATMSKQKGLFHEQ